MVLPSRLEAIDEARSWVSRHARDADVDADSLFAVELALTEALSNVIRHSYDGDSSEEIELSLLVADDRVELRVVDHGRGFERSAFQAEDLDRPRSGGYGVHVIEQLMDEVDWRKGTEEGNVLELVKFRGDGDG